MEFNPDMCVVPAQPTIVKLSVKGLQVPNFGARKSEPPVQPVVRTSDQDSSRVFMNGRTRNTRNTSESLDTLLYQDLQDRVLLLALDEALDLVMECPFDIYNASDILQVAMSCAGTLTNFDQASALKLAQDLQEKKTKAKAEKWLNTFFQPPKTLKPGKSGKPEKHSTWVSYDAMLLKLIQRKEDMHGKYYRVVQKQQAVAEKLASVESRLQEMSVDDKRRESLEGKVMELELELEFLKTEDKTVAVEKEWSDLAAQIDAETRRVHAIISEKIYGLRRYNQLLQVEIETHCQAKFDDVNDEDDDVDEVDDNPNAKKVVKKRARKTKDDSDGDEPADQEWQAMEESSDEDSDSGDESNVDDSDDSSTNTKDLIKRCKTLSSVEKAKLVKSLFPSKSALKDLMKLYE